MRAHLLACLPAELAAEYLTNRVALQLSRLFARHAQGWGARGPMSEADHVYPFIVSGRLRPKLARLPVEAAAVGLAARVFATRRESEPHLRLKEAGLWWMRESGANDARLEAWFPGGKADAYSEEQGWAVECGVTRLGKLQDAASSLSKGRFTLLPFQPLTWADGRPRGLLALEFEWGDELRADLYTAIWRSPTPSNQERTAR